MAWECPPRVSHWPGGVLLSPGDWPCLRLHGVQPNWNRPASARCVSRYRSRKYIFWPDKWRVAPTWFRLDQSGRKLAPLAAGSRTTVSSISHQVARRVPSESARRRIVTPLWRWAILTSHIWPTWMFNCPLSVPSHESVWPCYAVLG